MTRRMKRRYIALHVTSTEPISEGTLMNALWKALSQLFGEYGASQTRLTLIDSDSSKKRATIRCSHNALEMVRATIASITEIDAKPVAIHVFRVSGTLKALQRKTEPNKS
jgi:ribonuclease P/MRP protein subunit POP5